MKTKISGVMVAGFCLSIALFSSGCVGMITRAILTKDISFQQVSSEAGPIADGQSRMWIYVVGGGPNAWDTLGRINSISFNKKAYSTSGNSFFYADVPSGDCRVTTSLVWELSIFEGNKLKPGKIQKQIVLQEGQEYFIKVQSPPNAPFVFENEYPFDFIERTEAISEMQSLTYWTRGASDLDKSLSE